MLEVAKIYSVVGELSQDIFQGIRPFRSPHHTTSRVGLIGGGSTPMPGEISMAHRGVLFLDEFPEFPRNVLEAMRQPLEDGVVTVSRAAGTLTFPARFLLLAASNPCPCGFLGHPKRPCKCAPGMILRYKKRLSGPLLDRIDLHIDVPPVEVEELSDEYESESSRDVRKRVQTARTIQEKRLEDTGFLFNSEMRSSDIKKYCTLINDAKEMLKQAVDRLSLSARSYFKTIKVAQTIADLEGSEEIKSSHIAEALQYRAKEL
ncbi:MAG: Mg chelatase-related protein [Candidatus Roizmanbacteria bacterium GW2011_GWA2_37_7]|uniref:Mg chelatase-related protein n=1 Tax=Candidatus Roizmanbacteria bacterium GW2011_GWA2_37_7 TaxID=1618481 RepID=A0A0G0JLN1_9BACT|nr:MAG: Mg chelatase-related protein [Candidatus Roizmanbacteria bacterium GW2011_GWA2_37_7]